MNILNSDDIEFSEVNNANQLKGTKLHKFIKITNKFQGPLHPGLIPEGVIGIVFGSSWNYEINKKNLPSTIKFIHLGFSFDQDLIDLPSGIEELTLGNSFQGVIKNVPASLQKLTIKSKYNKKLPYMPYVHIYMYSSNISDDTFNDYVVVIKKCKERKKYAKNDDLVVIKMKTYKTCGSCFGLWLRGLLCCC